MTDREIEIVAKIMLTADSWCSTCQSNLFQQLREAFPDHRATIDGVFDREEEIHAKFKVAEDVAWTSGVEPRVWKL